MVIVQHHNKSGESDLVLGCCVPFHKERIQPEFIKELCSFFFEIHEVDNETRVG